MKNAIHPTYNGTKNSIKIMASIMSLGLIITSPAFAGDTEANTAISRADAKIEMATRQAGLAGNSGDQSYNMARERLVDARNELSQGHYDNAQNLADEAALLAELTGEKAKLAALQISNNSLAKASNN